MHVYDVKHYVNDVNRKYTQVLSEYDGHKKQHYSYDYGHQRLNQHNHREGKTRTYTTDGRGSVASLDDSDDEESDRRYSTFGLPTKHNAIKQPFGYNSEAHDVTGLQYLRARYYDPSASTFITQDTYSGTLTTPLTQNRYTYVGNNPINYIDPSGHYREPQMVIMDDGFGAPLPPKFDFQTDVENQIIYGEIGFGYVEPEELQRQNQIDLFLRSEIGFSHVEPEELQRRQREQESRTIIEQSQYLQNSQLPENSDLLRNATKALAEAIRHFCETGERVEMQDSNLQVLLDQYILNEYKKQAHEDFVQFLAERERSQQIHETNDESDDFIDRVVDYVGEVSGADDLYRVVYGKDPITDEEVDRLAAGLKLTVEGIVKLKIIKNFYNLLTSKPKELDNLQSNRPDFYVTPRGDVIPSDKNRFYNNINSMKEDNGKYYGNTSDNLPVRIRIEDAHAPTPNYNGPINNDHLIDHIHIEYRKNGFSGPFGVPKKDNNITIPQDWIR